MMSTKKKSKSKENKGDYDLGYGYGYNEEIQERQRCRKRDRQKDNSSLSLHSTSSPQNVDFQDVKNFTFTRSMTTEENYIGNNIHHNFNANREETSYSYSNSVTKRADIGDGRHRFHKSMRFLSFVTFLFSLSALVLTSPSTSTLALESTSVSKSVYFKSTTIKNNNIDTPLTRRKNKIYQTTRQRRAITKRKDSLKFAPSASSPLLSFAHKCIILKSGVIDKEEIEVETENDQNVIINGGGESNKNKNNKGGNNKSRFQSRSRVGHGNSKLLGSYSSRTFLAIRGGETHRSSMNFRFGKDLNQDYDEEEEDEEGEEYIDDDDYDDDDDENDPASYSSDRIGRAAGETVINLQGENFANTQNNIAIDDVEEDYGYAASSVSDSENENENDFGDEDLVDEEDFNDDAMWPKIKKEWRRTPPISKGYISISIALTGLSFLTSKNEWPEILQLDYSKALLGGQIWRLITPFFHHGPLGLNYFLTLQFVWTYMAHLERMGCHDPAIFPTALLFGATLLLIGSHIFQFAPQWLGHNLSCFLVYIWSRLYEGADVDVMGLFHLPAHLLPWFLVAQTLLLDHIMPWPDLLGIAVGHFYHDLTIRKMLKPPTFLKQLFNYGPLKKVYAKIKDETM